MKEIHKFKLSDGHIGTTNWDKKNFLETLQTGITILEWKPKIKLNLGCGNDKREGYINCDWSKEVNPDMVVDLNKRLPFEDSSVDEVILFHVLEHFQEPLKIIKEIYRVCKRDAIITIRVPYFSHESAFSMLDHYHQFTWTSFDALQKNHACHWQSTGSFKIIDKRLIWRKKLSFFNFFNSFPRIYQELFCWMLPAYELGIKLRVEKELTEDEIKLLYQINGINGCKV